MFLDKLIVNSKNGIIREIPFKIGLNLIIDDSTRVETDTGNNVGKTTLLRAVDFCFGSEGSDIYTDKEFGTIDEEVYDFLKDNEVYFELILKEKQTRLYLSRGFKDESMFKVNDNSFETLGEYKREIENHIFKIYDSKPSLRQIMPKFIRKDSHAMSNTVKYLHSTTTAPQYEMIYFYLFGFEDHELLKKRYTIKLELKALNKRLIAIKNGKSLSTSKQILKVILRDIEDYESKLKSFKIDKAYQQYVERLNEVKRQISNITIVLSNSEMKLNLNLDTLQELEENRSSIDPISVKELYKEVNKFIPKLQKSFEEALSFHNQMINNKINFINKGILSIENTILEKKKDLKKALKEESELLRTLSDIGSLSDLEKFQRELNRLYERKGEESKLIGMVEDLETEIKTKTKELEKTNNSLDDYLQDFEIKITSFNLFFSNYSRSLYDEEYVLSYEIKDDNTKFVVANVKVNVGDGKKKGQVAAFDLAYISFLNEMESELPKFVMHDSIEDIHINQIITLFQLANSIHGQYIVAVLRDKIQFMGSEFIDQNMVMSLSQQNKFFGF